LNRIERKTAPTNRVRSDFKYIINQIQVLRTPFDTYNSSESQNEKPKCNPIRSTSFNIKPASINN
jgi:hypothetical protein